MTEPALDLLKNYEDRNEALEEMLHEERQAKVTTQTKNTTLEEENRDLQASLATLEAKYAVVMEELDNLSKLFDPTKDDLDKYRTAYEHSSTVLDDLENQLADAKKKLTSLNTRNVNKKIKRRDATISHLTQKESNLLDEVQELKEELNDTKAKLNESIIAKQKIVEKLSAKGNQKKKVDKRAWRLKQQLLCQTTESSYSEDDVKQLEDRIDFLNSKNKELEQLIALMEEDVIVGFQGGRYKDEVRETIISLLQMNVAMSKVNDVIQIVLKKFTGKKVDRLPTLGKISQISLEARYLADVEVALAMQANKPDDVLGNCIHGDGTTKYHKKWQNFQVTLPNGEARTMGLMQMAGGDTESVMDAFKERIMELADTLDTVEGSSGRKEQLYEELITTIKSTMTDQGPSMPQFSAKLEALRTSLLPKVVKHWETLPTEVQENVAEFGTFFCKMHPLINFAEEINKVLKSLEDITSNGKNIHTIATAEAGVTRLVRTASKAFHHRGSDQSGAEDVFTSYLSNQYNTHNHLPYYVGNRANIIFESAAATYFHVDHIITFVQSLPEPNKLLQAVAEDAGEMINRAELRALGILFKCVTAPLWHRIKNADNVLSLNPTLHQLQEKLEKWKDDATDLFNGETVFDDAVVEKDDIYEALFKDCDDPQMEILCIQALELTTCAMLLILNRQCADQLPGGKYWNLDEQRTSKYQNVPSTNMIGERDFAMLDCLIRQKPNVRCTHLETLIMWSNNGTRLWLDGLDPETKAKYMAQARAHAPEIQERYKKRIQEIKKQRWINLQEKQKKKIEKEQKKVHDRVKLTNDITSQGGIWCTEEDIEHHYEGLCRNNNDETVRRAIYAQLNFHQKILQAKAPLKEYFQLSRSVNGKPVKYTKQEMKTHLVEIITANDLSSVADKQPEELMDIAEEQPPEPVKYIDPEIQSGSYADLKVQLAGRIEAVSYTHLDVYKRQFANKDCIGAALLQETAGEIFPVSYASKKLNETQKRYSVIEKECLAIIWGVQRFEPYLYGREFVIQRDHQPLTSLRKTQVANGRILRWALILQLSDTESGS
ncbi:uncharacterized protein LOC117116991 [Anneissia japonica]|uniref:uncharacterized protein LOC117116991 n=1 Tax=Anneissia japonica TaxID=1529436 RepID=UPI001425AE7E|nr:uncharacterized protein LOC117116991 [Anneissia japonica]